MTRSRIRFVLPLAFVLVLAVIGGYLALVLTGAAARGNGQRRGARGHHSDSSPLAIPPTGDSRIRIEPQADLLGAEPVTVARGTADSTPLPIASITKLITALVVLDAEPIALGEVGPTLTFTKADSDLYDDYYVRQATIQPMRTGSTMSLHDALELMLVASASNYAEVVSTKVYGSQARFLTAARNWLTQNGLLSTNIFDPTGLDPRNVSSAENLIQLADIALADPVVAEIVAMPATSVEGLDSAPNNNDLVGTLGIDGIKTGTLEEAGSCLLFSASVQTDVGAPVRVTGVVLGGASRSSVDDEVRALLASIQTYPQTTSLIAKGDTVGSYTTAWGETADVVAGSSASVVTWDVFPITSDISTRQLTTSVTGADVGSVTFRFGEGEPPTEVPLELDATIVEPDAWWRITHPQELLTP